MKALAPPVPANAARWMDVLRAVLATVVAFAHGWGLIVADHSPGDPLVSYPAFFLAGFAHPAVILFFVLSGFWIAKSVESLDARGWSWRDFLTDRWSRLGIVVVPALALGFALDAIGLWSLRTPTHLGETNVWFLPTDLAAAMTPMTVLGNLLFVQHILVHPLGSNGPLWSVAYEFWFYLWFAAAFVAIRRRRPGPALLLFALGAMSPPLLYGFLAWLTGVAAYHFRVRLSGRSLVPLGTLLGLALIWARVGDWFAEDLILGLAAAAFIAALAARDPRCPPILDPVARFGAMGSFSLYAVHFPIMALAAGLIVGPSRLPPSIASIIVVLSVLIAVIAVAIPFARLTEARTPALRRFFRPRTIQPAE